MKPDRYKTLVGSVNQRENDLDKEISIKERELDTIIEKDKWLDWIDTHLNNIEDLRGITDIKERKKVVKDYVESIGVNWNEISKQHTINITFRLPLVKDGISYKKGKSGQYLRDRKGFKKYDIIDGEKTLSTPTHSENHSTEVICYNFFSRSFFAFSNSFSVNSPFSFNSPNFSI